MASSRGVFVANCWKPWSLGAEKFQTKTCFSNSTSAKAQEQSTEYPFEGERRLQRSHHCQGTSDISEFFETSLSPSGHLSSEIQSCKLVISAVILPQLATEIVASKDELDKSVRVKQQLCQQRQRDGSACSAANFVTKQRGHSTKMPTKISGPAQALALSRWPHHRREHQRRTPAASKTKLFHCVCRPQVWNPHEMVQRDQTTAK